MRTVIAKPKQRKKEKWNPLSIIRKRKPEPETLLKRRWNPRGFRGSFRYGTRLAATLLITAVVLIATSKKALSKPPPFYKNTSAFSYLLKTPTEGLDGNKTNFWVKEAGASFKLPLNISIGGTSTSFAVMALGGVTRCEGVPMAETDFGKFALTTNVNSGEFTFSLGARHLVVSSKDAELQMGPRTITIPGETMTDWDFGAQAEWKKGRGKAPVLGFLTSAKVSATEFDAQQSFRENYWVFSGSVGFDAGSSALESGWGLSVSGETKSGNVGIGADKGFAWKRGKYLLLMGAGYDLGPGSVSGYLGAKAGPVMILPMYQAEKGDRSWHLLVTVNPSDIINAVTGKGKTKGPGQGN